MNSLGIVFRALRPHPAIKPVATRASRKLNERECLPNTHLIENPTT
jgi:hypothetical protein